MSYVDLETKKRVYIECDLGDGAQAGTAVFCRAEQVIIPGRLKDPRPGGGIIDNPSVVKFCTGCPRVCPSRQMFMELQRTQQEEAARERRVQEIEQDLDSEVLEEFTTKVQE